MDVNTDKISIELTAWQWDMLCNAIDHRDTYLDPNAEKRIQEIQDIISNHLETYHDENLDLTKPLEL